MLSLGQLYTDNTNDDANDDDDDDTNDTRRTNNDCIGSLACMPNEPKTSKITIWNFRLNISCTDYFIMYHVCVVKTAQNSQ